MLKLTLPILFLIPFVASSQDDYCTCMDKETPQQELVQLMISLDEAVSLAPPVNRIETSQQQENIRPEPQISESRSISSGSGTSARVVKSRKARKPSKKGMKPRKKVQRYRGQCPRF